jgi:Fe-coproporphyrin III synthase
LKKKYPNFVVNGVKQLSLMKGNWGGIGTTPVQCPSWAILSLDHMGRVNSIQYIYSHVVYAAQIAIH